MLCINQSVISNWASNLFQIGSAGSEVAHRVAPMLATVRRSNVVCGFPAPRFHEDALFCDAIEGISLTSCTNPYSP